MYRMYLGYHSFKRSTERIHPSLWYSLRVVTRNSMIYKTEQRQPAFPPHYRQVKIAKYIGQWRHWQESSNHRLFKCGDSVLFLPTLRRDAHTGNHPYVSPLKPKPSFSPFSTTKGLIFEPFPLNVLVSGNCFSKVVRWLQQFWVQRDTEH